MSTPQHVPVKTKIGWGSGGCFENTVGNSIGVMALPIFNLALGLSPVQLGWAMGIPRILDALTKKRCLEIRATLAEREDAERRALQSSTIHPG